MGAKQDHPLAFQQSQGVICFSAARNSAVYQFLRRVPDRSTQLPFSYSAGQHTLAIEQNTLTLGQVTAVLNGKRVLAPLKDITEVRNTFEIYERLEALNPYSIDDLLAAHAVMMRGLEQEAGEFRSRPVGVVNQAGEIVHFGTLPQYVPEAVTNLLEWVKSSELPMLIRSCVFHYEFELIHPFADGNGRTGRLWHTLLLSEWNPIFVWLPVESIVHDHQQEYYEAINRSNAAVSSTAFIEFMLSAIKASLMEGVVMSDGMSDAPKDKTAEQWKQIEQLLEDHDVIQNADVRQLCEVSAATANRILAKLAAEGKLVKCRKGGHWTYRRMGQSI